ncbi:hypothetical protein GCM10009550_53210 [Actinocorallia libanotica]|uniref:Uncharacterized protein n=1 Tax=Actinocorallia libanotica TaxID=46162 RepID=A0ABN1RPF9_9ACTN
MYMSVVSGAIAVRAPSTTIRPVVRAGGAVAVGGGGEAEVTRRMVMGSSLVNKRRTVVAPTL